MPDAYIQPPTYRYTILACEAPASPTAPHSITHSPLPVTRFEALVTVRPATGTGADITWEVDYDPQDSDEATAAAAREAIEAVYGMMAGWLADAATQRGRP